MLAQETVHLSELAEMLVGRSRQQAQHVCLVFAALDLLFSVTANIVEGGFGSSMPRGLATGGGQLVEPLIKDREILEGERP